MSFVQTGRNTLIAFGIRKFNVGYALKDESEEERR